MIRIRRALVAIGAAIAVSVAAMAATTADAATSSKSLTRPPVSAAVSDPATSFIPTTGCRLYDSRSTTPLNNGTIRTIDIYNKCDLASIWSFNDIYALSVTFSTVSPTATGYVHAWRSGDAEAGGFITIAQYAKAIPTSTGAIVRVFYAPGSGFVIHNYGGPTNFVVDLDGAFVVHI